MKQAGSLNYLEQLLQLARVNSSKRPTGVIRKQNSDFQVEEMLGFTPSGEGPHLWVYIEKVGVNTADVIQTLSKQLEIPNRDIGVSGLKDKNAVTKQWISLPMEKIKDKDSLRSFSQNKEGFKMVESSLHRKKLKRGVHKANEFCILIRQCEGEKNEFENRLATLKEQGVPNYFGEQRFGRNANNLKSAERYFSGDFKRPDRHLKSLLISAARSWVFNQVLSFRIQEKSWDKPLLGEAVRFDGGSSFFIFDGTDKTVAERVQSQICHPTGPLWGKGVPPCEYDVRRLEQACAEAQNTFSTGLESAQLKHQRRSLRVNLSSLQWHWIKSDILELKFVLPRGTFATSVLRELIDY